MKKIFISLAAIAALVSCVEEKGLEPQPQQPVGNQVTIKAVAAETKTAIADDGTSIVWENGDAISLIFDYGTYKSAVTCETELTEPNSSADFKADLTDVDYDKVAENVNLLYPASAFNTSESKITFKVPAEQDGTVGTGGNLSYALLTKTAIAGGTAEAHFINALSLFKITVPAGVKTLKLTADRHISGTATYKFNDGGVLQLQSTDQGSSNSTVILSSESGLDADRTYDVLVYPGDIKSLALELTGTDGAAYTKTLKNDDESVYMTLEAGKYYDLKIANLFSWNTDIEKLLSASPLGGEVVITASTTADYDYVVTFTNTDETGTPDWISDQPFVKGFHKDEITLYVKENTSGETRTAKVTVSYGNGKSQVFTVTQASAFMDFVYTDENPIEWKEDFVLFSDESLSSALTSFTQNVFTIELSDDYTKGTYILKNLFKVDRYNDANLQPVQNKGGQYYANFDAEKSELTVLKDNSVASYTLPKEGVVLKYDSANKKFSADKFEAAPLNGSIYYESGSDRYIGNYIATVKVEEPESGDVTGIKALYGTYNESVRAPYSYSDPETLVISESDDALYDLKMLFFYTKGESSYSYDTAYGKVSEEGKTITVTISGGQSVFYGQVSDFTLTVNGTTISGSYCGQMDYSATR